MSLTRERTVWCDGKGCPSWAQSAEPAKLFRMDLRAGGWTRVDGKDYCPACAKKAKRSAARKAKRP
jgi:hypothetical protein